MRLPETNSIAQKLLIAGPLAACLLTGCRHSSTPAVESDGSDSLALSSSSFQNDRFPVALTCDGANTSPVLRWNAPPAGTRGFALILYDRDTPRGGFVHWVLFNLPSEARSLPEEFPTTAQLRDGTRQGRNDFGQVGYGGPCPPGHNAHRYVFMLFALDTALNLPPGATRAQLDDAMQGHVLSRGTLSETFSR